MSALKRPPDPRIALLRQLADPLRLRVVDRLGHAGPATVTQLADELGVPLPQLSNHLRRLRDAGLVTVERSGRRAIYALADPSLEALLPVLDRITGRVAPRPAGAPVDHVLGRRCYDHLAGRLGVGLYRILLERGAVRDRPDGTVELGAAADEVLGALGVDVAAARSERRRLAFECLDAREHAPHLAGALGAAIAAALHARRWTAPGTEPRAVTVTPTGRRALRRVLGADPLAAATGDR